MLSGTQWNTTRKYVKVHEFPACSRIYLFACSAVRLASSLSSSSSPSSFQESFLEVWLAESPEILIMYIVRNQTSPELSVVPAWTVLVVITATVQKHLYKSALLKLSESR